MMAWVGTLKKSINYLITFDPSPDVSYLFAVITALKRIAYIILTLLCPLLAIYQQFYMKGQVRDEGGSPLQNVTMLLHSSGYLYKSGSDGRFGIMTPAKVDTLTSFREGYQKEKRIIAADKFNDIVLKKAVIV